MVFESETYKQVLRTALEERRKTLGKTFTYQGMAKACRVQKTYLSRVFNGDAHLSDDQLFLANEFLGLGQDERLYVTLLHQFERSGVQPRRRVLKPQIDAVRQKHMQSERHLSAPSLSTSFPDHSEYYLDPHMQLVHMYLTIPRFLKDLLRVRLSLGLTDGDLARLLAKLSQLGLVRFVENSYQVVKDSVHLSSDSPLYKVYRKLLRLKALERLDKTSSEDGYSFSVVFTATEEVRRRVQTKFLAFMKEVEEEVKTAPAGEVYQMNFDLFRWSTD